MPQGPSTTPIALTGFRVALGIAWAVLFTVSVHAVQSMGVNAAGAVFIGDFAHPWRAQFNTDFTIHLLLAAAWMIYRSRSWLVGVVCAILAINLGGVFTLAYLLVATFQAKGDFAIVLLGHRASVRA
jgi:hypothetical protein